MLNSSKTGCVWPWKGMLVFFLWSLSSHLVPHLISKSRISAPKSLQEWPIHLWNRFQRPPTSLDMYKIFSKWKGFPAHSLPAPTTFFLKGHSYDNSLLFSCNIYLAIWKQPYHTGPLVFQSPYHSGHTPGYLRKVYVCIPRTNLFKNVWDCFLVLAVLVTVRKLNQMVLLSGQAFAHSDDIPDLHNSETIKHPWNHHPRHIFLVFFKSICGCSTSSLCGLWRVPGTEI